MSWTRQLMHVLAKDLRAQRWWLLLYSMQQALATAPVWHDPDTTFVATAMHLLGVTAIGTALLACFGVIRADAPLGSRALWPTLPLERSAVFSAKLAFVLALGVALPMVVHGAAWVALGLPVHHIPSASLDSGDTLLATLLGLVLMAAGVETGGKLVFLFGAGLTIVPFAFEGLLHRVPSFVPSLPVALFALLFGLAALRLLYTAYHTRHDAVATRWSLVLLGLSTLGLPHVRSWASARQTESFSSVLPGSRLEFDRTHLDLRAESGIPRSLRAILTPRPHDAQVNSLRVCDRSLEHLTSIGMWVDPTTDYSIAASRVLPANLTWRALTTPEDLSPWSMKGTRSARRTVIPAKRLQFFPDAVQNCERASWYLLAVERDSLLIAMPASHGTRAIVDGRRIEVRWPGGSPDRLAFEVTITHVPGRSLVHDRGSWRRSASLVLINRARHEAISLEGRVDEKRAADGAPPIRVERFATYPQGYGNFQPVLPWDSLGFASRGDGLAWLHEAELHIIVRQRRIVDITRDVRRALRAPTSATIAERRVRQ